MGQGDHSKQASITILIPDPIVTFQKFQSDKEYYKKLKGELKEIIWGEPNVELPADYWKHVEFVFSILGSQYSAIHENILKYTSSTEVEEVNNYLSEVEDHVRKLHNSFQGLILFESPDERNSLLADGLGSCEKILHAFADRQGLLFKKAFLTTPFLFAFAGIYRSYSKLYGSHDSSRQRKEMECLEDTLAVYKNACIQERLDNIKMLRTQSESFNVHDYSYEAQIRKDVSFGGTINDFYDKRAKNDISFRSHELVDPSDADKILAQYKEEIGMQYELFFRLDEQEKD